MSLRGHVLFYLPRFSHVGCQPERFEIQNPTPFFSNQQLLLLPWPYAFPKQWD
jgi:hypothetical protein